MLESPGSYGNTRNNKSAYFGFLMESNYHDITVQFLLRTALAVFLTSIFCKKQGFAFRKLCFL